VHFDKLSGRELKVKSVRVKSVRVHFGKLSVKELKVKSVRVKSALRQAQRKGVKS
jgi:hypothetical protein